MITDCTRSVLSAKLVAEFGGGIGEVAASGLAAAAAGGASPERVETAVTFKRNSSRHRDHGMCRVYA